VRPYCIGPITVGPFDGTKKKGEASSLTLFAREHGGNTQEEEEAFRTAFPQH
jgi:hypothetical protein